MKFLLPLCFCIMLTLNANAQNFAQKDQFYHYAFQEIELMLKTQEFDFKQAVFLMENAYLSGKLQEKIFKKQINQLVNQVRVTQFKTTDTDSAEVYGNYAIYQVLTKVHYVKTDTAMYRVSNGFEYNFEDAFGLNNWQSTFVNNLLITKKGNCQALSYLYKIIADEIGVNAYLSLAPNHIYLKHKSRLLDGSWYNTDLTNRSFPTDAWLMASSYINLKALQKGTYLRALSEQEEIALVLVNLAQGLADESNEPIQKQVDFQLECLDLSLRYYPNNIQALLLKAKLLGADYLKTQSKKILKELELTCQRIYQLGYQEMPELMYKSWFATPQQFVDSTTLNNLETLQSNQERPYITFDKAMLMMGKGSFLESSKTGGASLNIGGIIYDTKEGGIREIRTNNNPKYVPYLLGRWLSVDPLSRDYPDLSPYNMVANSPLMFIDPDGRRIWLAEAFAQDRSLMAAFGLLTHSGTARELLSRFNDPMFGSVMITDYPMDLMGPTPIADLNETGVLNDVDLVFKTEKDATPNEKAGLGDDLGLTEFYVTTKSGEKLSLNSFTALNALDESDIDKSVVFEIVVVVNSLYTEVHGNNVVTLIHELGAHVEPILELIERLKNGTISGKEFIDEWTDRNLAGEFSANSEHKALGEGTVEPYNKMTDEILEDPRVSSKTKEEIKKSVKQDKRKHEDQSENK